MGVHYSVELVDFLSSNFCFSPENLKLKALSGLSRGCSCTLYGLRKDFVVFRSWAATDLVVFSFLAILSFWKPLPCAGCTRGRESSMLAAPYLLVNCESRGWFCGSTFSVIINNSNNKVANSVKGRAGFFKKPFPFLCLLN